MSKRKKYTIIGAVMFALLIGVVVYLTVQEKRAPDLPPPSPDIPSYFREALPIEFSVQKESFDFPSSAPLLSLSRKNIAKSDAQEIAQNLGFEGQGIEFEDDQEGIKYYWTNQDGFFVATPRTAIVKYGLSDSGVPGVIDTQLTDQAIINTATGFLIENGVFEENKIRATTIVPYEENPVSEGLRKTDRENAEVFQVNFSFSVSEREVMTINPSVPLIYVRVLPNGDIFNFQALLIEDVTEGQRFPIKSYEEVSSSISNAQLISLLNDYISISELSARDIEQVTVEEVGLVYLLDSYQAQVLQPVYLLEGPVSVRNSTADRAQLYLPALKD